MGWLGGKSDTKEADQFAVQHSDTEWKAKLSPEQFRVLREHGTERAGTSKLNYEKRTGLFSCAACGQKLFTSDTKYESGSGWPSFFAPIEGATATTVDRSHFMTRTEVHCSQCGGHLGHLFPDGPAPHRRALLHERPVAQLRPGVAARAPDTIIRLLVVQRPGMTCRCTTIMAGVSV